MYKALAGPPGVKKLFRKDYLRSAVDENTLMLADDAVVASDDEFKRTTSPRLSR